MGFLDFGSFFFGQKIMAVSLFVVWNMVFIPSVGFYGYLVLDEDMLHG